MTNAKTGMATKTTVAAKTRVAALLLGLSGPSIHAQRASLNSGVSYYRTIDPQDMKEAELAWIRSIENAIEAEKMHNRPTH